MPHQVMKYILCCILFIGGSIIYFKVSQFLLMTMGKFITIELNISLLIYSIYVVVIIPVLIMILKRFMNK